MSVTEISHQHKIIHNTLWTIYYYYHFLGSAIILVRTSLDHDSPDEAWNEWPFTLLWFARTS